MRLFIDSVERKIRKLSLKDEQNKEIDYLEGSEDLLLLVDELLRRNRVCTNDLGETKAKITGESRVGILIGVSAANALNYVLGLKPVDQLEYPEY